MPITLIAALIDPYTLDAMQPSDERRSFFRSVTSTEYSPPVIHDLDSTCNIQCPFCVYHTEISTRYWNASGTGWAQPDFKGVCPICYQTFTKKNLGVRKFCDELALKNAGGRIFFSYESRHGRAICLLTPSFAAKLCSTLILEGRMNSKPTNICKVS